MIWIRYLHGHAMPFARRIQRNLQFRQSGRLGRFALAVFCGLCGGTTASIALGSLRGCTTTHGSMQRRKMDVLQRCQKRKSYGANLDKCPLLGVKYKSYEHDHRSRCRKPYFDLVACANLFCREQFTSVKCLCHRGMPSAPAFVVFGAIFG